MTSVTETFTPVRLAASGAVRTTAVTLGGFLCTTAGTLQLRNGPTGSDTVIVSSMPVAAGVFYPLPFKFPLGLYADLGGGAVGTFGLL